MSGHLPQLTLLLKPLVTATLSCLSVTAVWAQATVLSTEQPGSLDTATSLNRTLNPSLRNQPVLGTPTISPSGQPAAPRPQQPRVADGVPASGVPSSARFVRKEAPVVVADQSDKPAVYTPDFSRQKLSFAQLVGQARIDLPRFENAVSRQGQPVTDVPEAETWSMLGIVDEGLTFSPVYRRAQAQLDNAVARRKQARADLLPVFSTSIKGGHAAVKTEGVEEKSSNAYRTTLTRVTQPIFNQTYLYNLSSSRYNEQSADFRLVSARESVILSLIQATAALTASRIVIGFADEQEAQLNEVFNYLETRAQAGASSNADLERARTRVLAARQTRIELQANYKSALYEMERLLGAVPKAIVLPYLNQLPALPQTKEEIQRLMASYNTELKALKDDISAQQALVSAETGRMVPSLALSAEHDTQRNISGPTAMQTDKRLVLTMNWAFSLGGKEIYGAQEAKAELRNREARYQEESRRLEQMLEADFALLQSATQRITTGQAEQRAAEAVVAAVREQLQSGRIGSLLDALDAFDRLFAARNRQVQALSQQMVAQAQLLRLIGMLSQMAIPAVLPSGDVQQLDASSGQLSTQNGL